MELKKMTPKKRVEKVLLGEKPDRIPFTIYQNMLPQCSVERKLRNDGLCTVNRKSLVKVQTPNVSCRTINYTESSINYTKTIIQTPVGELYSINRKTDSTDDFTSWNISKLFKSPEDYKKLLFIIKDTQFEPYYEDFLKAEKELGEDAILRGGISTTPLHEIMISWMGIETFAVEWAERRDEIEKIYRAKAEKLRELYPIIAESPAFHFNFGGNETGDVMGRQRFEKYVIPLYYEAAEILHKKGKLIGAHLDGNNKVWADLVASSPLDFIEAFTPFPDTDMKFTEALEIWKGKVLWINFTSSLHLAPVEEIKKATYRFIEEAKPDYPLIIGITEEIPRDRWQKNLLAISEAINNSPL